MGVIRKFRLAAPGIPYLAGAAFLAVCAQSLDQNWLAVPLWIVTAYIAYFFRDPDQEINALPNQVLSPADGRVVAVELVEKPDMPQGRAQLVSIFMSLFDIHVNRVPVSGKVRSINHHPGGFVPADQPRARTDNEHNEVLIDTEQGKTILVSQVAGLVARHIECRLTTGQAITQGERYGMIRFGSRLDVYLPEDAIILVSPGKRVKGGISPIGEL
ncbi:phosphatidylserine decarboxylase family protein [Dethiosulfatarculus sandiegensis]|uniref:Phosphatidylserine decarboxylase proenzyme n=1 Tax=Dethiosulfatarculus sandiegensis TaxID=1429043 RepID=A0A0D2GB38_9BACT|nr:phosphatidylserine decarboxylase family protein [Dethiosulfatarculus sandiegensis]KIX12057.1 hypothetical protein X474_21390 [Dethiosulfatarculus sandiegensis]